MVKIISFTWAEQDDPIYKESWTVFSPALRPPTSQSEEAADDESKAEASYPPEEE